jgi:hypothetical protein
MRRVSLALTLLVCLTTPVVGTVIVPAEFREIVGGSQIIVYGRVLDVHAIWVDDRRQIDTIVTVEAGTYLKGGPGETVTFRVPGGQIGRYRNVLVGAPEFRPGDEAILFLRANGPSIARVFGLNQGVFRVSTDARTGRRVVIPPPLMARGDAPETVTRGAAERQPLSLDDFAGQVRQAMSRIGEAR